MEYEISRRYESGSLSVTLRISQTRITVAQRIQARLEVIAPEGRDVTTPGVGIDAGRFTLADFQAAPERTLDDGRVLRVELYVLEPFLAGDYLIPSFKVSAVFIGHGDAGTRGRGEKADEWIVETEGIPIEVVSVLPAGDTKRQIRDIAPLAELPPARWGWFVFAIAAGVIALAGAAIVIGRRRMQPQEEMEEEAAPLAHEIAWRELERLLAEDLIAKGQISLFYTRLTGILRHYIEDRFGYHAPVRTTEEFLDDIRADADFEKCHGAALKAFLEHCDLVKFAGDQPGPGMIENAREELQEFHSTNH